MHPLKYSALALTLSASFCASAMTSINDTDLSQVSGQDGVSIIADLNIFIDRFTYTDDGANFSITNLNVKGMIFTTIDIMTASTFVPALTDSVTNRAAGGLNGTEIADLVTAVGVTTGWTGQDVVQIAFPQIGTTGSVENLNARNVSPTITGGLNGYFGFEIKNLDLQGTKIWIYGH